jgi:hypothetical protein
MKRSFYILCAMILGVLLSFLLHLPIVLGFFRQGGASCAIINTPFLSILCLFPTWALWSICILGIVGGFWLGRTWWRIIYIEKRRWR